MTIYVQSIDITPSSEVVVSGQVSSTNLSVGISQHVYIMKPVDGVWGFSLYETIHGCFGATMMVPFSVRAGFAEAKDATGVRIHLPKDGHDSCSIVQLKARRVADFTTETENSLGIRGAHYDAASNNLVVDIEYVGDNREHHFALEWNGTVLKSNPVQYPLNLIDLSKLDSGKAIFYKQLRFDLSIPELALQVPSNIALFTKMMDVIGVPGPRRLPQ